MTRRELFGGLFGAMAAAVAAWIGKIIPAQRVKPTAHSRMYRWHPRSDQNMILHGRGSFYLEPIRDVDFETESLKKMTEYMRRAAINGPRWRFK